MSAFPTQAVVLVPFPFTDRAAEKRRPAVVLSEPGFQQACGHLLLVVAADRPAQALPGALQAVHAR